jgi:predicted N-acetyltransferase YhbS
MPRLPKPEPVSRTIMMSEPQPAPPPVSSVEPEFQSRAVRREDYASLQALHDRVFGPGALTRTAYRVREGMPPQSSFCRVVTLNNDQIIASIRFTPVSVGGAGGALLLGPLAVDSDFANQGHGRRLIREGLAAARDAKIGLVLLVGDTSYYAKLGFELVPPGRIQLPGPFDPARLLAAHVDENRSRSMAGMVHGAA